MVKRIFISLVQRTNSNMLIYLFMALRIVFRKLNKKSLTKRDYLFAYNKAKLQGRELPGGIFIAISNICNLNCPMCQPNNGSGPKQMMPFEDFALAVEQCKQNGINAVNLHNVNEPILHPDILKIIFLLEDSNLYFTISTNGQAIDKLIEAIAASKRKPRELLLRYSIDGGTKETYEICRYPGKFEKILHNIPEMQSFCEQNNIRLTQSFNYVLSKISIKSVCSFYFHFKDYFDFSDSSFSFIGATWMEEYDFIKENRLFVDIPAQKCKSIDSSFTILPNLKVSYCCGDKSLHHTVVGDLNVDTLDNIYFSEQYKNIRKLNADSNLQNSFFSDVCRKCQQGNFASISKAKIIKFIHNYLKHTEMHSEEDAASHDAQLESGILKIIREHEDKKKVAFITDSLSLPRPTDQGNIPEQSTYPFILRKITEDNLNFGFLQRAGRSIDEVQPLLQGLENFDLLFIHIGPVDCYPCVLLPKEKSAFSGLSAEITCELRKYIRENKSKMIDAFGNKVRTPPEKFRMHLQEILALAQTKSMKVIVSNIISAEQKIPFLNENIDMYNQIIQECVQEFEQYLFDANAIAKNNGGHRVMLLEDNHHLSVKGNRIFAEHLAQYIQNILTRKE